MKLERASDTLTCDTLPEPGLESPFPQGEHSSWKSHCGTEELLDSILPLWHSGCGREPLCQLMFPALLWIYSLNTPRKIPLVPFPRGWATGNWARGSCGNQVWPWAEATHWLFLQTSKLVEFSPSFCKYIWHCLPKGNNVDFIAWLGKSCDRSQRLPSISLTLQLSLQFSWSCPHGII